MKYKKSIILVTTLIVIFTLIIIQSIKHPFEYVVVNGVKIETQIHYDIEESGNDVYLYLPVNFEAAEVEVNLFIDDQPYSNYPIEKLLHTIDSMLPQEVIEDIYVGHQKITFHIIVQ